MDHRVTFLLLNAAFGRHLMTHPTIFVAMAVIIVNLILADVLSAMNTDRFQDVFFYVMIISVVIISSGISAFQVCAFSFIQNFQNNMKTNKI